MNAIVWFVSPKHIGNGEYQDEMQRVLMEVSVHSQEECAGFLMSSIHNGIVLDGGDNGYYGIPGASIKHILFTDNPFDELAKKAAE